METRKAHFLNLLECYLLLCASKPKHHRMNNKLIVVAGGTGLLGGRIIKHLIDKGAEVRFIVRSSTDPTKIKALEALGAKAAIVDMANATELTAACTGAACVVSALAGLSDVILDAQIQFLNAAVAAGVPRFIPSDYSIDFTGFKDGENRNLDLRRRFHAVLDKAPIKATTIFNGAFMDMLTGQMPMIIFKKKLVMAWGDVDHPMYFTTVDNTAEYTASAALDPTTPRYLRIAGDLISPLGIKNVMSDVSGTPYRLFRPGGQGMLGIVIKIARTLSPSKGELYPAWQGMQYMHNMIDKRADVGRFDNDRYPMHWTTVKDLLTAHLLTEM
jgi:uncharacterized protein YbjT (DUF2867 family)